nr:uncharacterized protein LOC129026122 [Pongo pygmaeus]
MYSFPTTVVEERLSLSLHPVAFPTVSCEILLEITSQTNKKQTWEMCYTHSAEEIVKWVMSVPPGAATLCSTVSLKYPSPLPSASYPWRERITCGEKNFRNPLNPSCNRSIKSESLQLDLKKIRFKVVQAVSVYHPVIRGDSPSICPYIIAGETGIHKTQAVPYIFFLLRHQFISQSSHVRVEAMYSIFLGTLFQGGKGQEVLLEDAF